MERRRYAPGNHYGLFSMEVTSDRTVLTGAAASVAAGADNPAAATLPPSPTVLEAEGAIISMGSKTKQMPECTSRTMRVEGRWGLPGEAQDTKRRLRRSMVSKTRTTRERSNTWCKTPPLPPTALLAFARVMRRQLQRRSERPASVPPSADQARHTKPEPPQPAAFEEMALRDAITDRSPPLQLTHTHTALQLSCRLHLPKQMRERS